MSFLFTRRRKARSGRQLLVAEVGTLRSAALCRRVDNGEYCRWTPEDGFVESIEASRGARKIELTVTKMGRDSAGGLM